MDRSILSVYNALSLCGDVFREEGETINNPPCFRIATELPITHYPLPITHNPIISQCCTPHANRESHIC